MARHLQRLEAQAYGGETRTMKLTDLSDSKLEVQHVARTIARLGPELQHHPPKTVELVLRAIAGGASNCDALSAQTGHSTSTVMQIARKLVGLNLAQWEDEPVILGVEPNVARRPLRVSQEAREALGLYAEAFSQRAKSPRLAPPTTEEVHAFCQDHFHLVHAYLKSIKLGPRHHRMGPVNLILPCYLFTYGGRLLVDMLKHFNLRPEKPANREYFKARLKYLERELHFVGHRGSQWFVRPEFRLLFPIAWTRMKIEYREMCERRVHGSTLAVEKVLRGFDAANLG